MAENHEKPVAETVQVTNAVVANEIHLHGPGPAIQFLTPPDQPIAVQSHSCNGPERKRSYLGRNYKYVLPGLVTVLATIVAVFCLNATHKLPPPKFKEILECVREKQFELGMESCEKQFKDFWSEVSYSLIKYLLSTNERTFVNFIDNACSNSWRAHNRRDFQQIPELQGYPGPGGVSLEEWVISMQNVVVTAKVCGQEFTQPVNWWLLFFAFSEGCQLDGNRERLNDWRNMGRDLDQAKKEFRKAAKRQFEKQRDFFDDNFLRPTYEKWYAGSKNFDEVEVLKAHIEAKAKSLTFR
jgi:hypothetical protein